MSIDIERLKHDPDYWNSVAPEGAEFYSVEDGRYKAGWIKDEPDKTGYHFVREASASWTFVRVENIPPDCTLIPRPSPAWDGDGLPPVGVECEGFVRYGASERWRTVEVLKHNKGETAVYVENGGCGFLAWCNTFRPLRTEKERVVEATTEFFTKRGFCPNKHDLGAAYDAGLLKMPEDDHD